MVPVSIEKNGEKRFPAYVVLTPARNEDDFIELTIQSMIRQTILPVKWLIVSDGSTDTTDAIITRYAAEYEWIEILRMPERKERHFAGKANAINRGYERLKDLEFDIVTNLDADVSFDEEYFAFLLGKFVENPALGVGGTPFVENEARYDYRFTSLDHVSGQVQMFRRECFEEIGGYMPRKTGGIDLYATLSARMHGWMTRTFPEKSCIHHRQMSTAVHKGVNAFFRGGYHDYLMGSHPLWQICRSMYQVSRRPYFILGSFLLAGYLWALITRAEREVPGEMVDFRKKDQMQRLRKFLKEIPSFRKNRQLASGPEVRTS